MAYTKPAGNNIQAVLQAGYVKPAGNNIQANFVSDIEVEIPEIVFILECSVDDVVVSLDVEIPEVVFTLECSVADVLIYSLDDAIVQYYFNVTGTENGVSDVELPISSFQARRRNDAQTYLSVVVPSYDFISDIVARQNGKMQIYQGYIYEGELVYKKKIIETVISKVDDYQGGNNNSIVLTGYLSIYYSPKTLNLSGFAPTYKSNQGGKLRYRLAKPSIELNPGDTVIINSDTFVVDTMSYSINAKNQQIEISSI